MTESVSFRFNLWTSKDTRPIETPSFQHYVNSLGDVPAVGDYVDMLRWSDERGYHHTAVRVMARFVTYSPYPDGTQFDSDDPLHIDVALMVEKASRETGMPDFRPS
jgi:hypothetical protein